MRLRTLIVDDEPLARERIRSLLKGESDIEIVGECGDGPSAVRLIREHGPDLVFLDVQMPELDGFGVLETVGADSVPAVVFVTAYDQYALQAFDVHALDYLLKPFDRERFERTLARARVQLEQRRSGGVTRRLESLLRDLRSDSRTPDRLVIKSGGRVTFLSISEIDWIEAAGNYVQLHVGSTVHLLRETMSHLQSRLPEEEFVRIHRSAIVRLERIRELRPCFHGDYEVWLHDGTRLTLSRTYRERLQSRLGQSL